MDPTIRTILVLILAVVLVIVLLRLIGVAL